MERSVEVGETAVGLLARLKDVLAFEDHTKDGAEAELPVKVWAEHAVNTRKTHKLLLSQLQVVKFLLDFLDSDISVQDASSADVRKEMQEAKQQWKALKAEYQEKVEAIEEAVPHTLAKLKEAHRRAQLLEETLGRYRAKKEEMEAKVKNAQQRCLKEQERLQKLQEQMEGRVAEAQGRLQRQREELHHLQRALEEQDRQAGDWREKAQTISDFRCFLEMLQGVKVTHASESDLELELTSHAQSGTAAPHCLKLRLHWREDGNIALQSDCPLFLLPTTLPVGSRGTVKDILLELQDSHLQQAQLLAEIESLQSCFAIDWQPEERLLRYLKPSSTCTLHVEPGYPTSGGICLLSIKSQHGTVAATGCRPPQETPSLKDWLEYLSTVDFGAPFLTRAAAGPPGQHVRDGGL
ncbi:PREDICTED: ZW10 interactor-like [Gekko japonicus]|uniref:ZW10 interactor-like n=1 Tax=Gekko japonicus TaxID=146911 RepID=A0ABM1K742_GEKJA|nr:PREDICTED: ZW10 interactor-like [Gekko japonicus]